jgi:hypothetical protein
LGRPVRGEDPAVDLAAFPQLGLPEFATVAARDHFIVRKRRHFEQGETSCWYAKSEKSWIDDPAGIAWETFHTTGEMTDYGDGSGQRLARLAHEKSCCVPAPKIAEPAATYGCP